MHRRKKYTHQFLQLSKEHIIIGKHIEGLEGALDSKPLTADISRLFESLCEDMTEHFALEEEVLFPAALMGIRDLDIVDRTITFSKEHGYFERDLALLRETLALLEPDAPLPTAEQTLISNLLQTLKHHARQETDTLFLLMDESRECKKILNGFLIS